MLLMFAILVKNGGGKKRWNLGPEVKNFVLILNLKRQ